MERENIELLRDYVAHESEPAFRVLVERHVDMVCSDCRKSGGAEHSHVADFAVQKWVRSVSRGDGLSYFCGRMS
jgi:hypothetical protein